jgi:hypothetical protein
MGQPGNILINKLGIVNIWYTPISFQSKLYKNIYLIFFFLTKYIKIIFKTGIIYSNHLFYNIKYNYSSLKILSLPIYITKKTLFKFYRFKKLDVIKYNIKNIYMVRRFLKFLNIAFIQYYILNNWLLILIYIYKPVEKFKKNYNFINKINFIQSYQLIFNIIYKFKINILWFNYLFNLY